MSGAAVSRPVPSRILERKMSLKKIPLRKLIRLMFSDSAQMKSLIRADIRDEIRKSAGLDEGGGDFHSPFWHDAKSHVNGEKNLHVTVAQRIAANKRRERLYKLLRDGFLDWWNNKRRWTNEKSDSELLNIKGIFEIEEFKLTIKIDNLLSIKIGESQNRIIYPYFAENPVLTPKSARLALWVISSALSKYDLSEFRILDVLRGKSFSIEDVGFTGTEKDELYERYSALISTMEALKKVYYPM